MDHIIEARLRFERAMAELQMARVELLAAGNMFATTIIEIDQNINDLKLSVESINQFLNG